MNLDEVVVEGKNVKKIDDGIAFLPTRKEILRSSDGFSLVKNMLIPFLNVNGTTVTSVSGDTYVAFIDGNQATAEEIRGLRTKDVTQVQILQHPSDPRFMGKPYVINYVVKRRNYGGYLKAEGNQTFLEDKGDYSVFGVYQRPTATLRYQATANYSNSHGSHESEKTVYDMGAGQGTVTRNSTSEVMKQENRNYGLNMSYVKIFTPTSRLQVNGGMTYRHTPKSQNEGKVWYDGQDAETTRATATSKAYSPFVSIQGGMPVGKGSLWMSANMTMQHTRSSNLFSILDTRDFFNSTKETSFNNTVSAQYYLPLGERDQMNLSMFANYVTYRINYGGTSDSRQSIDEQGYGANALWWHTFSDSWKGSAHGGLRYSSFSNPEVKTNRELLPVLTLSLNGTVAERHFLKFNATYSTYSKPRNTYTNVHRQDDEINGTTGNAEIKSPKNYFFQSNYYWNISNKYGTNLSVNYRHMGNILAYAYTPLNGVMYSYLNNKGHFNELWGTADVVIKLLNYSLSLRPRVSAQYSEASGLYPCQLWSFSTKLSIQYSISDHFFLSADGEWSNSRVYGRDTGTNYHSKNHWNLSMELGFAAGDFAANLAARPLYKYRHSVGRLNGPNIWRETDEYTRGNRFIEVSARYYIDYGKKVKHGNEYLEGGQSRSAIL